MGEFEKFEQGMNSLKKTLQFNSDITVSLFETTIRVLGGLLSIHLSALQFQEQLSGPYNDEFLHFAVELGNKLLPAFNTPTGIPWSRVEKYFMDTFILTNL